MGDNHLGTGRMQFNSSQPTSQAQPTTPNSHLVGQPGPSPTTQPITGLSLFQNSSTQPAPASSTSQFSTTNHQFQQSRLGGPPTSPAFPLPPFPSPNNSSNSQPIVSQASCAPSIDQTPPVVSSASPQSPTSSGQPTIPSSSLSPSNAEGKGTSSTFTHITSMISSASYTSHMAAITAALSRDDDSPPSTNQNKRKLNAFGSKNERDEGEDEGESSHGVEGGGGGKGMSFDCGSKRKQEIETETEPMDEDYFKVLKPDELRQVLMPTLEKYQQDPFCQPVDPQSQQSLQYTCNNCKVHVETCYHCTICDDFDLCVSCYDKDGHPHKMEKLGLDLDDAFFPADQNQADSQETQCPVPFCLNIKYKMKQQKLQARLQEAQLQHQRIAVDPAIVSSSAVSPGAQQAVVMPALPAQIVKQVQEEAAGQQAPLAVGGNVNPTVPQVIPPPQLQMGLVPGSIPGTTPPLLSMDQCQQNRHQTAAGVGLQQPNAGLRQPSPLLPQGPPAQEPMGGMQQAQPGPNQALHRQTLRQLLQTLRSPNTPEQQQQILQILKSNPQLMAAFIKQRQMLQAMQQQQL